MTIATPYGLDAQTEPGMPLAVQRMTVIGAQCALQKRGFALTRDGYFGPQTKLALETALLNFRRSSAPYAAYADFERTTRTNATHLDVTLNFRSWLYAPAEAASCASLRVPGSGRSAPGPGTPPPAPSSALPEPLPTQPLLAESKIKWGWVAAGGALALLVGGFLIGWGGKRRKKR